MLQKRLITWKLALEVAGMKKLLSLILVLALAAAFPVLAYASAGTGADNLAYNDWDDESWDDYDEEINYALIDKVYSDWKGDGLPFWCWYDIDQDGIEEVIVDNSNGKKGVETVNCKMLKGMGAKSIITKGSFTVYYWDYETQRAETLKISSDNMFLSVSSRYLVASSANGNTETYTLYGFYPQSVEMLSETYTLTYSGNSLTKITVKDSFGRVQVVDEDDEWLTSLKIIDILDHSVPLVFYQTS